jgi:hypothetical protein
MFFSSRLYSFNESEKYLRIYFNAGATNLLPFIECKAFRQARQVRVQDSGVRDSGIQGSEVSIQGRSIRFPAQGTRPKAGIMAGSVLYK